MTIDSSSREKVLQDYRKKLTEHREVEARLKHGNNLVKSSGILSYKR